MSGYLFSVVAIVLSSAIFYRILPTGKTGESVKLLLKIVSVLTVLSPFLALFRGETDFFSQNFPQNYGIFADENFIDYHIEKTASNVENDVETLIKNTFFIDVEATLIYEPYEEQKSVFSMAKSLILTGENIEESVRNEVASFLSKKYILDVVWYD